MFGSMRVAAGVRFAATASCSARPATHCGRVRSKSGTQCHRRGRAIAHVPLDASLLPSGGTIAELGLVQIEVHHRREARIDLAAFTGTNAVHGAGHVVVVPRRGTPPNTAKAC